MGYYNRNLNRRKLTVTMIKARSLAMHSPPDAARMKHHGCVADPAFKADVLRGLSSEQKALPARWLYDRRGSELFEEITTLAEYYPTRTERAILKRNAADIARLTGPGRAVVEFGSGSSTKTPLLLSAIQPAAYVPIDISGEFLPRC